jgi:ESCRT-I complex subunit TSG101
MLIERDASFMSAVVHDSPETLITKLKCYGAQSNRVVQDVNNLLRQSNSIASQIGQLVHNDGRSSTLLQLYGTVPIYYKSRQYNIPINIWLVEKYPTHPPTCYVTPTKDMRIKPGHRHVDAMGLIYLPYLNQWNANSSNLAELVCPVLFCPIELDRYLRGPLTCIVRMHFVRL